MKEKLKRVICALFGHSRIQDACLGYFYCARCAALVADKRAGWYSAVDVVIVNHDCEICRKNYAKLRWHEKLFVRYPFRTRRKS